MSVKEKKKQKDLITQMFVPVVLVMIFIQLVSFSTQIIDGIITSFYYGKDAYSAISLLSPLCNFLSMICAVFAGGCQILSARKMGEGELKVANSVFSTAIITGIFAVFLFIAGCLIVPDVMFSICGVKVSSHPELYDNMGPYLKGYLIGAPAIILVQILSPIVVLDNNKKLVTISMILLCGIDIIGDLVNVHIFDGGTFGMGVATSISNIFQLCIILLHFFRSDCSYHFSIKNISFGSFKGIVANGSPEVVKRLANILRDLFINRLNIMIAVSTAAVAARGIQNDINMVMFAIGIGISKAAIPIVSLYYGAKDMSGIKRIFQTIVKCSVILAICVGGTIFVCAKLIVMIYTNDVDVVTLAVFSIRCMAVVMVFDTLCAAMQGYFQGIKNVKMANMLSFSERFFVPVITAAIMGFLFGSKGLLASVAICKVVLAILMFIFICVRNHGIPKYWINYMFLPTDFGGKEEDNLYLKIFNMNDVIEACKTIGDFAKKHNIDHKRDYYLQLLVEELASNSVKFGVDKKGRPCSIEIRIHVSDDNITLTIKNDGGRFDPIQYYNEHKEQNIEEDIGIKTIMGLAKDIKYINTLNTNNILISL